MTCVKEEKMSNRLSRVIIGTLAVVVACASASFAQREFYGPAVTFANGIHGESDAQMYGWTFDVVNPGFRVNVLGIWDINSDGVGNGHGHQVGLWDGAGTLLASTTVDLTASIFLPNGEDRWAVNQIPELILGAGSYTVGALYPNNDADLFTVQAAPFSSIPELVFGNAVTSGGVNAFVQPTTLTPANNPGYFGPIIGHVGAPEPGSFALLALGAIGGGVLIRRRRR
jgi:hypothetical protein